MTRPMTMAEKILADHAGLDEVVPGQLIECKLDGVLANDITAPIAIKTVRDIGAGVWDKDKIFLVCYFYSINRRVKKKTFWSRGFLFIHLTSAWSKIA